MAGTLVGMLPHTTGTENTYTTYGNQFSAFYNSEGITNGLKVQPTDPLSTSVDVTAGALIINLGSGILMPFNITTDTTLAVPNNTLNTYHLVYAEIDTSNLTASIDIVAGTSGGSTDPNLTETATLYYLPIARIITNGGNVTASDIIQDNSTQTNNATPETIGAISKIAKLSNYNSDWTSLDATFSYSSADDPTYVMTVEGNYSNYFSTGVKVKLNQTTDKYFVCSKDATYATGTTTITLYGGQDYDLANAAISNVEVSKLKAPLNFPFAGWVWNTSLVVAANQLSPTASTWYYSTATIDIPIGNYAGIIEVEGELIDDTGDADLRLNGGLSLTNSGSPNIDIFEIGGIRLASTGGSLLRLRDSATITLDFNYTAATSIYIATQFTTGVGSTATQVIATARRLYLIPMFI